MKFNLQIVTLLFIIFLAMQENSFSVLARPVKKVSHVLTTKKEMADSSDCFSLPKEIVAVERFARKLTAEVAKKAVSHSLGNRKGEEEEEEEDISTMAFSSDYHPPKPHPPKNN
ncbi:uncharacterized protein LOC131020315 [Salvia miltiorrhiza]|uniref:uncharacterized protein LOC131020315 n=1 Tax=Salvia miltiorrhiza TaxID=226208 RepID=UPI0025ABC60E|nr:uncharacterized protein LOC131020315 [Salvia miltiorrhiza]